MSVRRTALSKDGSMQGESPRDEGCMMSAEEVARHILAAVTKRKRTLVLTGEGKAVVALNKVLPSLVEGMVYNSLAKEEGSPFR